MTLPRKGLKTRPYSIDMEDHIVTLPKRGLKTRPYSMDMNKDIVNLPKKGLKTRPYNIGMEKKGLKKYDYNIDMEKKDLKKLTKGQLIRLLLKKVNDHEDLLDNDPFKDEVAQEPTPPQRTGKWESVKPKPVPRKSVNEDGYKPIPKPRTDRPLQIPKIKELNRALKGHVKSYEIELQDNLNPLNHFTKTRPQTESHLEDLLTTMKGFKFVETLEVTFEKDTIDSKTGKRVSIYKTAFFNGKAKIVTKVDDIEPELDMSRKEILNVIDKWVSEGSGWVIDQIDSHYLMLPSLKLHANYVLVPADKAANNVIIVCNKYYIDTLVKELGINNVNINNPTYIPIDDSFETIMKSHNQFITAVGLEISEEDQNLPYLYWRPKLHKSPYKHRFIAGSSKCTTKDLSCLLTKVLSTIKDGLVRYCNTKTSHNGVNNMWILKNSTSLLSSLDQLDVRTATSVQTFHFSTLYTSIPHDLLKSRISNLVHNAFRKKDGSVRYTHIKVTRAKGYFTHDINGSGDNMYTADNICKMIEFLIDNIFVQFGGRLFRQVIGIPMGTNCAPLLADLFLYSYENEFLDNMIRSGHRRLARSFNLCYRYIDDLIVFNNKKFLDYLKEIYPSQLTVEKANKSDHLADYLDLTFIIDTGGKLSTRLYDKRDDFDFHIVNFPYLSSNIPSGPSYGVYISHLIRYTRCCSHYDDFRYRHKCLVDRLLSQGYIALRLEKSFKKFYGRYQDLIEKYQRSVNVMVNDSFPG